MIAEKGKTEKKEGEEKSNRAEETKKKTEEAEVRAFQEEALKGSGNSNINNNEIIEKKTYVISEEEDNSSEERTTQEITSNRSSEILKGDEKFIASTPWEQALERLQIEEAEWDKEWDKINPDMMGYEKRGFLSEEGTLLQAEEVLITQEDKNYLEQATQEIELAAKLLAQARERLLEKEESRTIAMDGKKIAEAAKRSILQHVSAAEYAKKAVEAEQNGENEIAARLREAQSDAKRAGEYYLQEAAACRSKDPAGWNRWRRFAWTFQNRAEQLERHISYLEEIKNASLLFGNDSPITNLRNKALKRQEAAVVYYQNAIQAHSQDNNLDWSKWICAADAAQQSAQQFAKSASCSQQVIKANATNRGAAFIVPLSKASGKSGDAAEYYFKAEQAYLESKEEEAKLLEKSAKNSAHKANDYFSQAEKLKSMNEISEGESRSGITTKETSLFSSAAPSGGSTGEKLPSENIFEPSKELSISKEPSVSEKLERTPSSPLYGKNYAVSFSASPEREGDHLSLEEQKKIAKQLRKHAEALTVKAKESYAQALKAYAEKIYGEASSHYAQAINNAEQAVTAWAKTAKAHESLPGRQWGAQLKDNWAQNVAQWKKEQASFFEELNRPQIETLEVRDFYSHQEKEIESLAETLSSLTLEKKNSSTPTPEQVPEIQVRIIKGKPKSQCPYIREEGIIDPQTGDFIVHTRMAADHFLVELKKGENPEEIKQIEEAFLNSLNYPGATLNVVSKNLSLYRLSFVMSKNSSDIERIKAMDEVRRKTQQSPLIAYSEPNFLMDIHAVTAPDDEYYNKQWSIREEESFGINVPSNLFNREAPLFSPPVVPITVAIIDSGIKYGHEDLKKQMWTDLESNMRGVSAFNATVREHSPVRDFAQDGFGHGTHCAGIIGATANNQKGIAGIVGMSGLVNLMACKYYTTPEEAHSENAIRSIEYAFEHGAKILNCSWGYKKENINDPVLLKKAFKSAAEKGVISVVSAGNDGINNDSVPYYPSCFATKNIHNISPIKNMLVVAATDKEGKLASWQINNQQGNVIRVKNSNYGKKTVHLAAPGKNILSTGHSSSKSYVTMTGTSMAAPHVVGALALMMAKKPFIPSSENLNELERNSELQEYNAELIGKLCETANNTPLDNGYQIQDDVKNGRLDLKAALESDSEED